MHLKDDPISDMHAKYYLTVSCLKQFPGPTKFGPVFSGGSRRIQLPAYAR